MIFYKSLLVKWKNNIEIIKSGAANLAKTMIFLSSLSVELKNNIEENHIRDRLSSKNNDILRFHLSKVKK